VAPLPPQADVRRIVVIGGGFAGLNFCKRFRSRGRGGVSITLVDRQNHHLFQPLLYQVATAGLSAAEIAQPLRSILRARRDVECAMGDVTAIDVHAKTVSVDHGSAGTLVLPYDFLIVAAGGRTSYFGHDHWAGGSLGLKTLDDAMAMRRRILTSFERAEVTDDAEERRRLMTIVVVGGGPTGVELAGALAELARVVFRKDFRRIDTSHARVILVERGDAILDAYPAKLRQRAAKQLERLGVQIWFNTPVTDIRDGVVEMGGTTLAAGNIFWTAGVEAVPLTRQLGVPVDRAGRVIVNDDLTVPGHPQVLVLGDAASVKNSDGSPVPGIAPAAIQMGKYAASYVSRRLAGDATPMRFTYRDKGMMATIGRKAAVAVIGPVRLSGAIAWATWLFVHVLFLVGLRNKVITMTHWVWAYATYSRGARVIFGEERKPTVGNRGR